MLTDASSLPLPNGRAALSGIVSGLPAHRFRHPTAARVFLG